MKILFLTQILPYPLDAGPKMRIYYVLRYLAQRHRVTLVSFVRGEKDEQNAGHLRSFLHAVHTVPIQRAAWRDAYFFAMSVLRGQPFLIARDQVDAMRATIARLSATERFDAVHADQLGMAQYALNFPGAKVLDEHNAVWTIVERMWRNEKSLPQRLVMQREWQVLKKYEARVCQQFDHILTVTAEDCRILQSLDASLPITVMPICIDTDKLPRVTRASNARHIICVGGMFYPPNVDGIVWFAQNVFPLVKPVCPDSDLVVVGARPAPALLRLAEQDARVRVTGYVDDPTELLSESAVFIVPLRAGGGMRVKILDAWSRGVPMVTTTIGCEGIAVRDGENILIADEPRAFADAVIRLIQQPALGQQIADNGRHWVEQRYHWRAVYPLLDQIYPPASATA
ncbi:MAG: glycosyltransferase [Chloroflexi bacterium]|nr:glycosyltransferase [Chloroflexota bacterium]